MNVFVKNLPEQMTEKQVNKYFRPYLERLGIKTYRCDKLKSRGCAILTILDIPKAQQFLSIHGQTQSGPQGFRSVRQKLFHQNRPVNCSLSKTPPDRFLVSSLEKQEKDRDIKVRVMRHEHPQPTKETPRRAYDLTQLWCGQWDYVRDDLTFANYYQSGRMGRIVFGPQGLFVTLTTAHQLEISYRSIHSITTGSRQDPSITFSLIEPPSMFEMIKQGEFKPTGDPLGDYLARLLIEKKKKPSPIRRKRIFKLDEAHGTVVSSCLCYRFRFRDPADVTEVQKLKQFSEIPGSIAVDTPLVTRTTFAAQMGVLMKALSDYHKMPFELKFQFQKLAQNGSLAPLRVCELLQAISRKITAENSKSFVDAVYQLYAIIPFPGPNTDSSDFALQNLIDFVTEKIQHIGRGFSYAESMQAYEHMILIHKATITPTRIYLDGPAPEVKNRVLRKYAAFSTHFLSVSFTDEDGEFLRHDRQTSTDEIYEERFKNILENSIAIAGRLYQVCHALSSHSSYTDRLQFLGFSHSSLRAHTCWYMAPFTWQGSLIHAQEVIKDLGDFSLIRSPAKCAARIGQAFSQTLSSIKIPENAVYHMPDVVRNGRTFSDGVGTCSLEVLHKIWNGYSANRGLLKPNILQVRFQGSEIIHRFLFSLSQPTNLPV